MDLVFHHIQVDNNQGALPNPEIAAVDEYTCESGTRMNDGSKMSFRMKLQHPDLNSVRDLTFAVTCPVPGLALIKIPVGFIALNLQEKKNLIIKSQSSRKDVDPVSILIQAEDWTIVKLDKLSTTDFWICKIDGFVTSLDNSLKEIFNSDNTQAPPSGSYQLRVILTPDIHSLKLSLGNRNVPSRLAFEITINKLPINETYHFNLKLVKVDNGILLLKEPRQILLLNQTKDRIALENKGTFLQISSKGVGTFDDLATKDGGKQVIHQAGKQVELGSALKLLSQEKISEPAKPEPNKESKAQV